VNLYRLRSAKHRTEKLDSRDGHEYIVPSLMASQICEGINAFRYAIVSHGTYSPTSTVEHNGLVKISIFFYCIDVLDHALGAIIACDNPSSSPSAARSASSAAPSAQTHHWSEHCHAPAFDTKHLEHHLGGPRTVRGPFVRNRRVCHG